MKDLDRVICSLNTQWVSEYDESFLEWLNENSAKCKPV